MLALPIFPVIHPTSIFGACELNFCVRYGNRWTLTPISTNYIYMLTTFRSITAYQHARAFKKGGDPYRIRTDVKGVRGLCLNHLTNGPACLYEAEDRLYTWSAFRDSNPGPTD